MQKNELCLPLRLSVCLMQYRSICKDNTDLGVSKFTLDRYDWDLLNWEYENLICIIRLGFSKSVSDVGKGIA